MSNRTDKMTVAEFRAFLRGDKPAAGGNPSPGNRKVRNAQKCERDGVQYDSRTERHMGDLLTMHGIAFEFQKKYTVSEGFEYNGKTVRPITYTVDFYLPFYDMAIDTKGVGTQQGRLRIKMLMRLFADLGRTTTIELPRTAAECDALVARLIENK